MSLRLVQGLRCPSCGGPVSVEEGRTLARCGGCGVSLLVEGMEGHPRYYVPNLINKSEAHQILAKWWRKWGHAADLRRRAVLEDAFLVYLPFWRVQSKVMGWVFGQQEEPSKKGKRLVNREKEILLTGDFTAPACAIQEFGIRSVCLVGDEIRPLDLESMEREGMVFQPVFPADEAVHRAEERMERQVAGSHRLDVITYENVKTVAQRVCLLYYPLWVMRYRYGERTYQVLIDGEGRKVLSGRAPGNDLVRACLLVGCMGLGNFALTTVGACPYGTEGGGQYVWVLLLPCLGLMYWGFEMYRNGGEVTTGEMRKRGAVEAFLGIKP